ncbi:Uncharacterized protein K02A2.6 [Mytilus coruscus]|uniref:Uncharacterized protein K02A2.6 n=1 Tax=Mytilus coruscus TaxID=42192 RepID=A0A6J8ERL6_MYTCO|nr:Uncharacterized protein K02A2.6 [Mytilus coruscus]
MFPNRKLDSTDVILRTFSGEKFKPLGVTAVNVNYNDQSEILYALRPKVEQELDRLEEEGIIIKVSTSEWATPIVPVVKKSGGVRICGDFKVTINQQLQVDQYPLPRIDDIFAPLSGGEKFSKIDLRQAYLQLEMNEESKKYLTLNTHRGLYQYNRMLFGVASAPAI